MQQTIGVVSDASVDVNQIRCDVDKSQQVAEELVQQGGCVHWYIGQIMETQRQGIPEGISAVEATLGGE